MIISLIISILSVISIIGYLKVRNFAVAVANEDAARCRAVEKDCLFDSSFSGKITAKRNHSDIYYLDIKLDLHSAFPKAFSSYYQSGSVQKGVEGLSEVVVSKYVYYYCRIGDIVEKDSCSDSIKVDKRKFLLFSKNKSEWVPHSN
nr:hypothetical protein [uncultured Bacteroides sp.]